MKKAKISDDVFTARAEWAAFFPFLAAIIAMLLRHYEMDDGTRTTELKLALVFLGLGAIICSVIAFLHRRRSQS